MWWQKLIELVDGERQVDQAVGLVSRGIVNCLVLLDLESSLQTKVSAEADFHVNYEPFTLINLFCKL